MPSLRKRRYRSGKVAWIIEYRVGGKLRQYTIGDVKASEARKIYHDFCAKYIRGIDPSEIESMKSKSLYRVSDLMNEYLLFSQTNKAENTCRIIREAFRYFLRFTSDMMLGRVDVRIIERFKEWRLESVKPTTLNIAFRALKAGFQYAVKLGWLSNNPFAGVKQVPVPEADYPMYLSQEEVQKLLSVIDDLEFRRLIRFYLLTGCRRSEVALLDWMDINMEGRTVVIRSRSAKNKRNRIIQVGEKLYGLLLEQGPKPSGRVFPRWKPCSITNMFRRYVGKCDFSRKITVHSLRHTATVHWLLAGVDIHTVSKILGHTSIRITETVYAHVPAARKQDVMDKLPY